MSMQVHQTLRDHDAELVTFEAAARPRAVGDRHWRALATLYLAGILSANALAAKLFEVGGVAVTAGAMAIPLVYLTTDLLNELYGARAAQAVVWMGFWANAVLVAMTLLVGAVPASPLGASQQSFDAVFEVTPRVVLASAGAYLASSSLDVQLFALIRRLTGERHFWLRKNGSTAVSQMADTFIFVTVAFAGVLPWAVLLPMMVGQYLVKMVAAPLGTPLSYAVLRLVRNRSSS